MVNFVDEVRIVCLHQLDYDVDEYLDFVLMVQYLMVIAVEDPNIKEINIWDVFFLLLKF
jgi:hypothetical protein